MMRLSNYSDEPGYVNIHGQDIKVVVCEKTGKLFIPYEELMDTGYRIYERTQFDKLLISHTQVNKELDMHLLASVKTYLLKHKIAFTENEILQSIDRCKMTLMNGRSPPQVNSVVQKNPAHNTSVVDPIPQTPPQRRVVALSPENFTVTTSLREPSASAAHSIEKDRKFGGFSNKTPGSFVNKKPENANFENSKPGKSDCSFEGKTKNLESPSGSVKSFGKANGFSGGNKKSQENDAECERLPSIQLDKPLHKVAITYVDSERPHSAYVQDIDNLDTLAEITQKIQDSVDCAKKPERLIWNKVYLASEDDVWYRCRVIKFKPVTVVFVDYGNTAEVTDIREAPEELHTIPAQCARVSFIASGHYQPEANECVDIQIKRKYDNGVYLVEVPNNERSPKIKSESEPQKIVNNHTPKFEAKPEPKIKFEPESQKIVNNQTPKFEPKIEKPPVSTFTVKPRPLCKLENGQRVMIVGNVNGKLALRSRECYEKLQQIIKAVEEIEPKSIEKAEVGQLVLCKKDMLRRAVILNIQKNNAEIEFIDFCEKIKVDLSSLKQINEALAQQPATFFMTPEIKGYHVSADVILAQFAEEKKKATVVLSEKDVDLQIGEQLLSNMLPSQHCNRPMFKNFNLFKPSLGKGEYTLNIYKNRNEMYFASPEALEKYLNQVIIDELDDNEAHEPVVGEICMGLYQECWSRCTILSAQNARFEVQFVDFGNCEFLQTDKLRKLPEDNDAPALAFRCQLTGLPDSRNIEEILKEAMEEDKIFIVDVKKCNGGTYEIEIPEIKDALRC